MDTLVRRHFVPPEKFLLVRQGYGVPAAADSGKGIVFDPSKIELFYSGSFYSFRRPDEVIAAVLEAKDVRLSVASINPPEDLVKAAQARPDAIRLLGFVPHNAVIEAQRQCDLLLNLANGDPVQVPGKLFEYLGAGRPILHIGGGGEDESSRIVADTGSGWSLRNAREDILGFLVSYDKKVGDELMAEKNKRQLGAYSWKSAASRLVDHLQLIIGDTSRNNNPSGTLMEQENDK
jgi:glycosyltransferase involved in cell wall biosynthesis